jgi:uncharacterized OB-fold protein
MEDLFSNALPGWQCPICKRVYSPYTSMCHYCGGNNYTTTRTTNGTGDYKEFSNFCQDE